MDREETRESGISIKDRFPSQVGRRVGNRELFFAVRDSNEDQRFISLSDETEVGLRSDTAGFTFRVKNLEGEGFQLTIGDGIFIRGAEIQGGVLYLAGEAIGRNEREAGGLGGEKLFAMFVGNLSQQIGPAEAKIVEGMIRHLTGDNSFRLEEKGRGKRSDELLAEALAADIQLREGFTIGTITEPEPEEVVEKKEWLAGLGLEDRSLEELKVLAEELGRLIQEGKKAGE